MWSNGFSFTTDLERRHRRAVVGVCIAGGLAGLVAVRLSGLDPWPASIVILTGMLSFIGTVRAEWPGSKDYVRRLASGPHPLWRLWTRQGPEVAELRRAWVAGPVAAIALRSRDGGSRSLVLHRRDYSPQDWRRLLVRLHHP